MLTGYTADIEKGITFEQFALRCARNFGALIMMRDEPLDAEIPEKFEESSHYREALEKAERALAVIERLTPEECAARANAEHMERAAFARKELEKNNQLRASYEAMLAKARTWEPPSNDHQGLKDFMTSQIEESIRFDCSGDYYQQIMAENALPGDVWKVAKTQELRETIRYYREEVEKERERVAGRERWVRQLRESLAKS